MQFSVSHVPSEQPEPATAAERAAYYGQRWELARMANDAVMMAFWRDRELDARLQARREEIAARARG